MHIDPAPPRPLRANQNPELAPLIRAYRERRLGLLLLFHESLGSGGQSRGKWGLRKRGVETWEPGILEGQRGREPEGLKSGGEEGFCGGGDGRVDEYVQGFCGLTRGGDGWGGKGKAGEVFRDVPVCAA